MIFSVQEDTLKSCCTFVVNEPLDKAKSLIEAKSDDKIDYSIIDGANGCCISTKFRDGKTGFLIWLRNFSPKRVENLGTVAHEINHLTFSILESKGIPIRKENDEVFCYVHDFYLRSFLYNHKHESKKS